MQPYKFKVKYLPGRQNIADPLSRLAEGPMKTSIAHKISDDFVKFVAVTVTPKAMTVMVSVRCGDSNPFIVWLTIY